MLFGDSLPSKNDRRDFKIYINYSNFINFTGTIWISQGLLDGDTISSDVQVFDLKISTSIAADAFCRLHNDKYTIFHPHENCGLLMVKSGRTVNLLGVVTQYEILEFCRSGLNLSKFY